MTRSSVLHLLPLSAYRDDPTAPIAPESLSTEGFVHCSPDAATALAVADALYRDSAEPMVALELDCAALPADLRWEAAAPAPPAGVSSDVLFPHLYAAIDRSAIIEVHHARRSPDGRYLELLPRRGRAEELDLLPHPEGGWYRRFWASSATVERSDGAQRPAATAIHYALDAGEVSRWHTVASEELWFWHAGEVELTLGGTGDQPGTPETVVLGPDADIQLTVPAGTWQRASASVEALVSCVVSPGFDFADFRVA
ncbi:cupin domain-containing protein [Allosaccharopolyspora coralli]|uniref:cupin domain-containing protein n=1 Tax=Allosaccharopolyspora coralli TaxID=2665642 RepID=UPI001E2F904F|nr:cupin domain-containing protein [Allosaccharopolyspora coralli]